MNETTMRLNLHRSDGSLLRDLEYRGDVKPRVIVWDGTAYVYMGHLDDYVEATTWVPETDPVIEVAAEIVDDAVRVQDLMRRYSEAMATSWPTKATFMALRAEAESKRSWHREYPMAEEDLAPPAPPAPPVGPPPAMSCGCAGPEHDHYCPVRGSGGRR